MWQIFRFRKSNSGEIARKRLAMLLISDQAQVSPGLVEMIREDMIGVLSRYAEFDSEQFDLKLTQTKLYGREEQVPALAARIPIRQFTNLRNE